MRVYIGASSGAETLQGLTTDVGDSARSGVLRAARHSDRTFLMNNMVLLAPGEPTDRTVGVNYAQTAKARRSLSVQETAMTNADQPSLFTFQYSLRSAVFALAVGCALALFASQLAQAQTFTVLHQFTKGADGWGPSSVTIDAAGNLYGGTGLGGDYNSLCEDGCGTVFKLKHASSGWVLSNLHVFSGDYHDGPGGFARVALASDGTLYSTGGGDYYNHIYSLVYHLQPPAAPCHSILCYWTYTPIYILGSGNNAGRPSMGGLTFDHAGNLYGLTAGDGTSGNGTVYELSPSNGTWTETILYNFSGGSDGSGPSWSDVILDSAGNLYGTTSDGGPLNYGTVFQLTNPGSGWVKNILYNFDDVGLGNGGYPAGGVIFDANGNLYGTASYGGDEGGGTAFELSAAGFNFSLIYSFSFLGGPGGNDGPDGSLTLGPDGSLYGSTVGDGQYSMGSVFKLTNQGGTWVYTSLHDFTGGDDGAEPLGNLVFDSHGNLYGAAYVGGAYNAGVVFEITP